LPKVTPSSSDALHLDTVRLVHLNDSADVTALEAVSWDVPLEGDRVEQRGCPLRILSAMVHPGLYNVSQLTREGKEGGGPKGG
jgi:hypothetical protein